MVITHKDLLPDKIKAIAKDDETHRTYITILNNLAKLDYIEQNMNNGSFHRKENTWIRLAEYRNALDKLARDKKIIDTQTWLIFIGIVFTGINGWFMYEQTNVQKEELGIHRSEWRRQLFLDSAGGRFATPLSILQSTSGQMQTKTDTVSQKDTIAKRY